MVAEARLILAIEKLEKRVAELERVVSLSDTLMPQPQSASPANVAVECPHAYSWALNGRRVCANCKADIGRSEDIAVNVAPKGGR